MSEKNTRTYELGYIFAPTVVETEVSEQVAALTSAITALEGTIISEGATEFIDLAYTMEKDVASKKFKYNQGYFGSLKFEAEPSALESLKKTLDGIIPLVRYILIKTSAENTIVFKKPKVEPKRGFAMDVEEELAVEEEVAADDAEDMKSDHEKLPDLEAEVAADNASTEA